VTWTVEALGDAHQFEGFDCGNEDLNGWLINYARHGVRQGTRTYVVVDDDDRLAGYFAVAPHVVEREETPRSIGRGAPRQIPAILLAKFALDRQVQGGGLGRELLVLALTTIVDAARAAGGKVVVVDAIAAAAASFYEHHDFIAVPTDPHRLVQKLSTVAAALGLPWP